MGRRIKVLHVETGMNLYGGALQVHYLLRGLSDREDIECALVCPKGSAVAEASAEFVKGLYTVPMKGDLDIIFIPRFIRIIKEENPDIIHLHSRRGADVLGGIAARLKGIRCIHTRRVDNPEYRLWAKTKYRLYNRVITISQGIREILVKEGVPQGKIVCVPSAVDTAAYNTPCDRLSFLNEFDLEEKTLACGVVAQFIQRKGHKYLLEAIPEILSIHPTVRFLFFGKGPLEGELRTMSKDLGIADSVIFAGFRDDLDRYMGCFDLLIHPALMEGLGVSLLQAAAAGIPIVATWVGGIPEIVADGVNGYLVPKGDSKSLSGAVIKILSDNDLAARLGNKGRKIAQLRFSIDSMVEGNLKVYREMMEK